MTVKKQVKYAQFGSFISSNFPGFDVTQLNYILAHSYYLSWSSYLGQSSSIEARICNTRPVQKMTAMEQVRSAQFGSFISLDYPGFDVTQLNYILAHLGTYSYIVVNEIENLFLYVRVETINNDVQASQKQY